ncbi:UDP-glucose/GDP-mannose dehydrogenase family protein [Kiloniella sp. EL199]|uniref:UDP-glucose dehydrogenase family protein n=1 Tax=Kiloniella sp. EL199 TaxID=2107581 RepID=UPI000EA0A2CE|nr:UDP-glucose/GDP-mannose dehydrogenase family protein [Kiloniella sp. EL199]
MRIAMIGTGYVGLVSGTCFSEFGTDVVCVDKDLKKIEGLKKGVIPIFEPGLDALVKNNSEAGRLTFSTDLAAAAKDADAIFIAVGTPPGENDGQADLSYVYQAAKEIADVIDGYKVIITKSTVPVGTGRAVERIIREARPDAEFDVVSNPEFLREGAAINDFMRPDRVVIGAETKRAQDVMAELYRPLYLIETPILFTKLETSELIKYAGNAFLATKISFINQMADLCEKVGADVHQVAKGIGLDGRIGRKFLHAGPGYGGSCFPKDTQALAYTAREYDAPVSLVEDVISYNSARKRQMAEKVVAQCGGSVADKKIAILGLTFKPNTDDMRDSPSLDIIPFLQAEGAQITAYDPEGMTEAQELLSNVSYGENAYEIMNDADALVIITEWNEFRRLDLERVKGLLKSPVMIDLRNIYNPDEMKEAGFDYLCVGRPLSAFLAE